MQRNSTIGELMERKRIQDGAKEYQGHTYMDLARFDEATKHMIKSSILSEIASVKNNSITAQRYYSGMKNIFSGIGSKIIGVVYTVLLGSISAKLRSYTNAVNDYEDDISLYDRKIAEIDKQIEDARKAEELAKLVLGGGQ